GGGVGGRGSGSLLVSGERGAMWLSRAAVARTSSSRGAAAMLGCRSVRPRSVRASTTLAEAAVERLDRAAPRVVVFYKRVLGRGSLADGRGSSLCSGPCASAHCTLPAPREAEEATHPT